MQVTFSADDPIDRVVAAVEAVYGVQLTVSEGSGRQQEPGADDAEHPDGWEPEMTGGKVRQDKT